MSDTYIPGSCNIGAGEIRRRKAVAVIGGILTLITFYLLLASNASSALRLTLFLPAMIFAIGWVQTRKKFCLAYGFMGTFNFGKLGELSKVATKEEKELDRNTAINILVQAIILALAITGIGYFWPN
ncbi:MAG: hypothetical protein F2519_00135 [Actinobacteria bacterium]|uniref:Unannotated protein n=1 Tax=freshwater metagenome TaxID=449393 RepID=A0A6J6H0B5_9ZZZZ|nr:hypothetical protein [Actinomycetota bacterium]MSW14540.1 hypothetical protein [Actinomycetota bacterium]MSY82797.1 hypothetical protein [Actinomycetota bacterium]MSZ45320.1 hypothetical protein [Actinomycetota bacterium]MTA03973.1 hypothetical protein [Actinomycetota bacterium]